MPIYITQLRKDPEIPFLPDGFVDEIELPPTKVYNQPIYQNKIKSHSPEVYLTYTYINCRIILNKINKRKKRMNIVIIILKITMNIIINQYKLIHIFQIEN